MTYFGVSITKVQSYQNRNRKKRNLNKITSLDHEILNDPVELAAFVTNRESSFSVLASAQLPAKIIIIILGFRVLGREKRKKVPEVLGGLWSNIGEELHLNAPSWDCSDSDVEEDYRILWVRRPHVPLHTSARRRHSFQHFRYYYFYTNKKKYRLPYK